MLCGNVGLEAVDPLRGEVGLGDPCHPKHALEVREVGRADVGELLFAVVRLVGESEAALLEEDQVPLGVARVVVDERLHEAADSGALELSEGGDEARDVGHPVGGGEVVGDRRPAQVFDALLVHERPVEVADLALLGALGGGLRLLDDRVNRLLGLLREDVERPVAGLVARDLGVRDPLAVGVPEEIVLDAHLRVEVGGVDSGSEGRGSHACQPKDV